MNKIALNWLKLLSIVFIILYALFGYFPEKVEFESECLEYRREDKVYESKIVILEGYIMRSLLRNNYFSYTIQIGDDIIPLYDPNIYISPTIKMNDTMMTPRNTLFKLKNIQSSFGFKNDIFFSWINYSYWNKEKDSFGSELIGRFYVDFENNIIFIQYSEPYESQNTSNYKIVVTGSNLKDAERNVEHIFSTFDE